ncbi:MAG: sensor domain-containing diguanylate cyclase, partial [Planctomycetales bacterium]|nr:sensor domain-containing diguanylate cyclase [Planctomycetales bacterium]
MSAETRDPSSAGSSGPPGLEDEVRRLSEERGRIETQLKRQAIAYSTVIEIANRINSTGLDLRRIESYTTTMLRGQFGVLRVFLLRQEPTEPERIRVTVPSKTALGGLDFPSEGPFAAQLLEKARPVPAAEFGPLAGRFPEYEALRGGGVEVCVPLLHAGTDERRELKGLLGVGEKIRRAPFTPADLELLQVLSDMVAISLNNAALYHRSIVDSLTRVYSRGHFDVHLHQELARARRVVQREENRLRGADAAHRFVTLVMLDIDHFKKVNDTHGHPVGDKVLRSVAGVLHQAVRTMDIVSRYGGEEFAIVFPETAKA